ncbi:NRPS protein [Diaporthe australafricana]|uniref:NRPS protein n=1 Tax=Diaporthe australafricana TaxID=127596 RepID=A0ABR3W8U6_9PEZI
MTEHAAYLTDALAQQEAALLNSSTRLFHFASYNFDATNFDILSTLIAGATICVPSEYNRINHLAAEINTLGANFLELTATVAQILDPQEVPGLEVVILCGEANSPEVVEKWVSAGLDVVNGYGPSEASCAFSYNIYTRQHPQANNIGRALKNACQGHIVSPDNHNQLLPVGALGELVIRGPTLGRGYLKEPEKTAAVYIDNPSWLHESARRESRRVYKTGDLVRQLPDHSFEIHGRVDKQVKLNGQRVELGDIEHKVGRLLRGYQSVAVEVLKLPWQRGSQTWLCAFYAQTVGNYSAAQAIDLIDMEKASINIPRIKSLLAEDLKSIAIPQAFVPLQFMPVTTQGKLDRKALQELGDQLNPAIWAKLSGSKLAEDYVKVLRDQKQDFEERVYVPFDAIKDRQELDEICSKAAQHTNVDDIEDIIQATDLQASCVAFSTTAFMAHRCVLYQIVSRSFRPSMRSHIHLSNIHDATERLMEEDKRRPVEMTEPQTAFELLSQGDKIERLVIRLSAAQYDGHSVAILGEEARTLLSGDQKLKETEGSYSAYLYHSRALQSAQAVEYWRHLLSGAKPTQIAAQPGMPTFQDFVDGVLARTVETRLLDLDRFSSLPNNSSSSSSTRATVVKTAWSLALAELTGQDDIVFGATAWGRNAPVPFAHDVVGCCASHVPVRARVGRFDTYAGLLGDLQAQHVESMRFEMLGANTIVRQCTDWPRWARLSSLLVFQGLDIDGEGQGWKEKKDSAVGAVPPAEAAGPVKFTEIMDPGDRADVILHVEPFGQTTRLLMAFSKRRVPDTTAEAMMDAFERYLGLVSQCATGFIRPRSPTSPLLFTVEPQLGETCDEKTVVFENVAAAQELVRSAWMNILGADAIEFEECKAVQTAFLEIWGNPVSAAGLARHYEETGLQVTTEEVLRCSSVEDQISLVSRKMKDFQQ